MTLRTPIVFAMMFVVTVATAVTVTGGCSTAVQGRAAATQPATTDHYYGTMSSSSPDGKVPYGPPVMMLVKRVVNPADETITETRLYEGTTHVTTLQREEGGRFRASSSDNTYGGTLEFTGDEWNWSHWTYAITMNDGSGRVEGSGHLDGKWIENETYFVLGTGEKRRRVIDRLVRITPDEYAAKHAEMIASQSTPASKRR